MLFRARAPAPASAVSPARRLFRARAPAPASAVSPARRLFRARAPASTVAPRPSAEALLRARAVVVLSLAEARLPDGVTSAACPRRADPLAADPAFALVAPAGADLPALGPAPALAEPAPPPDSLLGIALPDAMTPLAEPLAVGFRRAETDLSPTVDGLRTAADLPDSADLPALVGVPAAADLPVAADLPAAVAACLRTLTPAGLRASSADSLRASTAAGLRASTAAGLRAEAADFVAALADLDATGREVEGPAGSTAAFRVRADLFAVSACAVMTFFADAAADVFTRLGSLRARRSAADGLAPDAGSGEAFVAFAITRASLPRLAARHRRIGFPTGRTQHHRPTRYPHQQVVHRPPANPADFPPY